MKNSREKVRQERESFETKKIHVRRMNFLKIVMGYSAIIILIIILIFCLIIIFYNKNFDNTIVNSAVYTFFGDLLGIVFLTYKLIFGNKDELIPIIKK